MSDLEKYNNQNKYPYEVQEKTNEFINLLKKEGIELILVDSPLIDNVGLVVSDRGLNYDDLIKIVRRKIDKFSVNKLYFYNLTYKFDKLCNGIDDYVYSDTFYVRWLFKK